MGEGGGQSFVSLIDLLAPIFFKSLIENYCAFHIKESRNSKASNQSEIF